MGDHNQKTSEHEDIDEARELKTTPETTGEAGAEGVPALERLLGDAETMFEAAKLKSLDRPAESLWTLWRSAEDAYYKIVKKYPNDPRARVGAVKTMLFTCEARAEHNLLDKIYRENAIRKSELLREKTFIAISDADERNASDDDISECVKKIRSLPTVGCYIATAVYGAYDAPETAVLRRFRDETLMKYPLGQKFVSFYYKHSPRYAEKLKVYRRVNALVKFFLDGFVRLIKKVNNDRYI
jgi:hypothetical protein